jgi:hypothetical protein
MLGQRNQILFRSPHGDAEDITIAIPDGQPMTLRYAIEEYERQRGFRHTLEEFHFSMDAVPITQMDTTLAYVPGSAIVASYAKVGGSC